MSDVINHVENCYSEYSPRLTGAQLEDYASQLQQLVNEQVGFAPRAVTALMRCAPTDLPASKRILLQEAATRAFEIGHGLAEVVKQLNQPQQKQQFGQHNHRAQTL